MTDAAEIKIKLVLDSNAEDAADKVKKNLDKVHKEKTKLDTSFKGNMSAVWGGIVGGTMAAAAAAVAAAGAFVGMGVEAVHAFRESEGEVRKLASTFTMFSAAGESFQRIHDFAADTKEELQQLGIEAGVADETMVSVFENVIERGGKTVEQAKELTMQMAVAGRAVEGGAGEISAAFENIEMGIIKAKNPIVGMIAATGMLKGNAKQVAKQMMAMTPEKQMELAEKAIAKMSTRMEKVPMSIGQMTESMKSMAAHIMEGMGAPIVHAISPVMANLREFFMKHAEEIGAVAARIGAFMGQVVEVGGKILLDVFDAIAKHSKDIEEIFTNIWGDTGSTWDDVYKNATAIAKTMGDVVGAIIEAAKWLSGLVKDLKEFLAGIGKWVGEKARGGALGADAQKFAIGAQQNDISKQVRAGAATVEGIKPEQLTELRNQYINNAVELGKSITDAAQQFDNAYAWHDEVVNRVSAAKVASTQNNAAAFAEAFNWAEGKHNDAVATNIASFIANNKAMQEAVGKAGPEIFGEGSKAFIASLRTVDPEAAKKISAAWAPKLMTGPKSGGNVIMNGTTINVKQDFRDQDPDRVAIVMRRDFAKSALNRIQARTATPFGV